MDQTLLTIEEAEREYEKIIKKKEQVMLRPTSENVGALVGKVSLLYSIFNWSNARNSIQITNLFGMISFIFQFNVNWFPENKNISNSLQVFSGGVQFVISP